MPTRIIFAVVGVTLFALLVYQGLSGRRVSPPVETAREAGAVQPVDPPAVHPSVTGPELVTDSTQSVVQPVSTTQTITPGSAPEALPSAPLPVHEPREETHTPPALEPEIRRALGEILNTSSEGLVEETRDGVTRVDLQNRFQTAPVATVDEQGRVEITDYTHLPPEAAEPTPP